MQFALHHFVEEFCIKIKKRSTERTCLPNESDDVFDQEAGTMAEFE